MDDWSPRVLEATEYGNSCFQSSEFLLFIGPQSEDCLFLNIFTPGECAHCDVNSMELFTKITIFFVTADLKPDEKLPVIFYIHGGGFVQGAGNEYEPDFLIEKNVILVIRLKLYIRFEIVN